MTSRRHSVRPVIVEVKPDNASNPSILSPSTPPATPPSPKAVRFATTSNQFSRPLTSTEAWSLYHFENHARQCPHCHDPSAVYRRGARLCPAGHGLAQDVAYHVYHRDGIIYSTRPDAPDAKLVRVEIPHGYLQLTSLLKAMDHRLRAHRPTPVVSYDRNYAVSARRRRAPSPEADEEPEAVIIEPAVSARRPSSSSKQKPLRYSTVVRDEDEDVEDVAAVKASTPPSKERRGTLYEKDMQRRKAEYRVEIREPCDRRRRREERKSGGGGGGVWS